jgi:hypothetical protein
VIIDIDSHFEPGDDWLDAYPSLKAKLPHVPKTTALVEGVMGDLLRDVPNAQRMSMDELIPPGAKFLLGQEQLDEGKRRAEFEGKNQHEVANAAARVAWLDKQGIDLQTSTGLSPN